MFEDKQKMNERFKEFKGFLHEYQGFLDEFTQMFMLYHVLAEINERLRMIFQELYELNEREGNR